MIVELGSTNVEVAPGLSRGEAHRCFVLGKMAVRIRRFYPRLQTALCGGGRVFEMPAIDANVGIFNNLYSAGKADLLPPGRSGSAE